MLKFRLHRDETREYTFSFLFSFLSMCSGYGKIIFIERHTLSNLQTRAAIGGSDFLVRVLKDERRIPVVEIPANKRALYVCVHWRISFRCTYFGLFTLQSCCSHRGSLLLILNVRCA